MITTMMIDPIEKKPLYHFEPGKKVFTIGFNKCNLNCKFCYNKKLFTQKEELNIDYVIDTFNKSKVDIIGFSYTEPLLNIDEIKYILSKTNHRKAILCTNGVIDYENIKDTLTLFDAITIGVKGSKAVYKEFTNVEFDYKNLKSWLKKNIHIELSFLIIPNYTTPSEFMDFVKWLSYISIDIPLHIASMLETDDFKTKSIDMIPYYKFAKKYLNHVYLELTDYPEYAITKLDDLIIIRESNFNVRIIHSKSIDRLKKEKQCD